MGKDSQSENSPNSDLTTKALATIDYVAPEGWRLKLAKAAAQLLVGTKKGALVYASAREHLDEIDGRTAMNKQLYAIAAQQVVNDPEMIERAKARLIGDTFRKHENLEAVIDGASLRMQALPAPDTLFESPSNGGEENGEAQPLDEDWAATFTEVAENANSAELRQRLSRILAGEIASAGTFPRAIVRAISDIEKSDLEAMLNAAPYIFDDLILADSNISKALLTTLSDAGLA